MQTSLHAGVTDLQWAVGAYALTFASIMLACGMIGDELESKVEQAIDKAALKAEKHVAKELDVKSKDIDKAVREAASEVS